MKPIHCYFLLLIVFGVCSCENPDLATLHQGELSLGKADYVNGWWIGLKPNNPMLIDTIYFDYENVDAADGNPVTFELQNRNGNRMDEADLYTLCRNDNRIDTIYCENNRFVVMPPATMAVIGIRFKEKIKDGNYGWTLCVVDAGSLERIEYPEGSSAVTDGPLSVLTLKAQFAKHANTQRLVIDTILVVLIAVLLLWIFVLKYMIFDRFKVKYLYVETNDYNRKVNIKGAISLCLTAKQQRQSVWERIFVGKRVFYRADFFADGDIIVSPRYGKKVKLALQKNDTYKMDQYILSKDDEHPLVVVNQKKEQMLFRL